MDIQTFIDKLNQNPESVQFTETIKIIDSHYDFTETEFRNYRHVNLAGQNNGSCKIFSFAKLHNLSKEATLTCFGDFYRKDVLQNPQANDHQNIRSFMSAGWDGISFSNQALALRS